MKTQRPQPYTHWQKTTEHWEKEKQSSPGKRTLMGYPILDGQPWKHSHLNNIQTEQFPFIYLEIQRNKHMQIYENREKKRKYNCAGTFFLSGTMVLWLRLPGLTQVRRAEAEGQRWITVHQPRHDLKADLVPPVCMEAADLCSLSILKLWWVSLWNFTGHHCRVLAYHLQNPGLCPSTKVKS